MNLTDAQLETIERLADAAIHELVFGNHHAQNDAGDDALTCLIQVHQNVQEISDMIIAAQKEAGEV